MCEICSVENALMNRVEIDPVWMNRRTADKIQMSGKVKVKGLHVDKGRDEKTQCDMEESEAEKQYKDETNWNEIERCER